MLQHHEIKVEHGSGIGKRTNIKVVYKVMHIPATKPEKKKFTHANVSVCKRTIQPVNRAIERKVVTMVKINRYEGHRTCGTIMERFFFIMSMAMFGSENIAA
jgi:hypothetical protein